MKTGLNALLILAVFAITMACAKPMTALERDNMADRYLRNASPDGCSYLAYDEKYQCNGDQDAGDINSRVATAKSKLITYFEKHPLVRSGVSDIIMGDLYGCTNSQGRLLTRNDKIIYCETAFADVIMDKSDSGTIYAGEVGGKHKYISK